MPHISILRCGPSRSARSVFPWVAPRNLQPIPGALMMCPEIGVLKSKASPPEPEGPDFSRAEKSRREAATALPEAEAKSEAPSGAEGD